MLCPPGEQPRIVRWSPTLKLFPKESSSCVFLLLAILSFILGDFIHCQLVRGLRCFSLFFPVLLYFVVWFICDFYDDMFSYRLVRFPIHLDLVYYTVVCCVKSLAGPKRNPMVKLQYQGALGQYMSCIIEPIRFNLLRWAISSSSAGSLTDLGLIVTSKDIKNLK